MSPEASKESSVALRILQIYLAGSCPGPSARSHLSEHLAGVGDALSPGAAGYLR